MAVKASITPEVGGNVLVFPERGQRHVVDELSWLLTGIETAGVTYAGRESQKALLCKVFGIVLGATVQDISLTRTRAHRLERIEKKINMRIADSDSSGRPVYRNQIRTVTENVPITRDTTPAWQTPVEVVAKVNGKYLPVDLADHDAVLSGQEFTSTLRDLIRYAVDNTELVYAAEAVMPTMEEFIAKPAPRIGVVALALTGTEG
ncbi:hypothetical protein IPP75_05855 [Candidatus Saccharibacteria bacterium]|nr:MAG: hypothetical protein IPP75_05855 [Candidatus Saccharibacteria bacterium]